LRTNIKRANGESTFLDADVIIDCTGLEADLREHRVLADLLDHSGAGRNPMNRLDVSPAFEIRGAQSGSGKLYASGATTLGGYYAGVDSFLGLQYAALQIVDDLSTVGFCRKIGVGRSISQWWKWMRKKPLP
jgi:lysine/ornithine N-monooxygenase